MLGKGNILLDDFDVRMIHRPTPHGLFHRLSHDLINFLK
jgi:hypothetical protein